MDKLGIKLHKFYIKLLIESWKINHTGGWGYRVKSEQPLCVDEMSYASCNHTDCRNRTSPNRTEIELCLDSLRQLLSNQDT